VKIFIRAQTEKNAKTWLTYFFACPMGLLAKILVSFEIDGNRSSIEGCGKKFKKIRILVILL
jgi:hypothetical protein